jgi:hypothetical protein
MKTYQVDFFYYTDCRAQWKGEAGNEFIALSLAMQTYKTPEWANEPGFKVLIECLG